MDVKTAGALMVQLLNGAATLLTQAQQVSGLVARAHAEGREISDAELEAVVANDDRAREILEQAIADAGGSMKPDAPR